MNEQLHPLFTDILERWRDSTALLPPPPAKNLAAPLDGQESEPKAAPLPQPENEHGR